ncbi:hypothetical protein [Streptomyces sp. NPDC054838]
MNALDEVTLSYTPYEGPVQKRRFFGLTPDDLVFILAQLHARTRRTGRGRAAATEALDDARKAQLEWYEDQLRLSLEASLGRWHRFVPASLRHRIVQTQMDHYFDSTAQWASEMADLYARVDRLEYEVGTMDRARSVPAPVIGPRMMCGHAPCGESLPLGEAAVLPHGWSILASGGVRCPKHAMAALAETGDTATRRYR